MIRIGILCWAISAHIEFLRRAKGIAGFLFSNFYKKSVLLLLLSGLLVAAPHAQAVPARVTNGLVGEWTLDSSLLGILTLDTSGSNAHGRIRGGSILDDGWLRRGGNLNGSKYVEVSSTGPFNIGTGSFTLAAWIKPSNISGVKNIIENRGTNGRGYVFSIYNGKLLIQLADENGYDNYISSSSPITTGRWYHVMAVVNRSSWPASIQLFVDGYSIGSFSPYKHMGNLNNTDNPLFIGKHKDWSSSNFRGLIDHVLIYNRALDTLDRFRIMNPGLPSFTSSYWNDGGTHQRNNNCYNYANNVRTGTFAQPGKAAGSQYTSLTCSAVRAAAIADGLQPVSSPNSILNFKGVAALVVDPYWDYHWYRRDDNGYWTHKPGQTRATNRDNSGNLITNPETANRGGYTDFCGYFRLWTDISEGWGHENIR